MDHPTDAHHAAADRLDASDLAARAFGINDLPPLDAFAALPPQGRGEAMVDLTAPQHLEDDAEVLRQIELIERVMERKRKPLTPAWQTGRYLSDRLSKGFLIPVIETAKFNPLLNRVHCVSASASGKAGNPSETQGILPVELASKDMFNFWWSSVLIDLLETKSKAASTEKTRLDLVVHHWLLMFRVAVQRCTVDRTRETSERSWLTVANALLLAFYRYATSGLVVALSDLDWKTAEAAMLLLHPDSSPSWSSSSTGFVNPGRSNHSHNNNNKRNSSTFNGNHGGGSIPWPRDWLERNHYPSPVRHFICQRCGERGFNASRCPCRDGKSVPGGHNKKGKADTDHSDRTTGSSGVTDLGIHAFPRAQEACVYSPLASYDGAGVGRLSISPSLLRTQPCLRCLTPMLLYSSCLDP
jgi:hypothetical protein